MTFLFADSNVVNRATICGLSAHAGKVCGAIRRKPAEWAYPRIALIRPYSNFHLSGVTHAVKVQTFSGRVSLKRTSVERLYAERKGGYGNLGSHYHLRKV